MQNNKYTSKAVARKLQEDRELSEQIAKWCQYDNAKANDINTNLIAKYGQINCERVC